MTRGESDTNQIISFLRAARDMERTYRFTPKPDGGFENDAEHSWSVSLICLLVATRVEEELGVKVDQLKMLQMAIIHDIAEVITGDTKTWDDAARVGKSEKERQAVSELFGKLPDDLRELLSDLWEECEERKSFEAMIVKSVDRFDPVIHRTFFGLGWDNVDGDNATSTALDFRQISRHSFSKTLTAIYTQVRDEAISRGLLLNDLEDKSDLERAESEGMAYKEYVDEELVRAMVEDLLNGSTPG